MAYGAKFEELQLEFWPRSFKISSFNFLVKLMHLKVAHKWTNQSFDMLCDFLRISNPEGNKVPKSHYDVKKKFRAIELGYESIHM